MLPLRTWTVEPASAVPASARLVSSVVPPLVSVPVTELALSVTVPMLGAAGAVWSIVVVKAAELAELPAVSVARAVGETRGERRGGEGPGAAAVGGRRAEHRAAIRISTVELAAAVPASARVVSSVAPPLVSAPVIGPMLSVTVPMVGVVGGVVSRVIV